MPRFGRMRVNAVGRALAGTSLASLSLSMFSGVALAQAADEGAGGLSEIVVTARKVEENLQDVPVSITAFSGDDLQNQNIQRVQDVANFTPGLVIRQGSSTPTAIVITLRGQVQSDILATLDPSVGTYVDGVYWARAYGLNSDILDASNVQILKGPQGTLFGRNTTGGALLINTNDPNAKDFSAKASVTYGRFNELNLSGVINVPIVEDKIAIRLAGQRFERDGYTVNTTATPSALTGNTVVRRNYAGSQLGRKLDNRDRWNFRGKLLIKPTERLSLLFSGEYFDVEENPSRQLVYAPPSFNAGLASATNPTPNSTYSVSATAGLFAGLVTGNPFATATAAGNALLNAEAAARAANPGTVANNEISYALARTHTYGFTGALDTDWGEIKLITGYRKVNTSAGLDLEGSSFAVHFTEGQQRLKQKSIELQFTGKAFGDAVDFAAGGFAFHESGFDQSISVVVPALNPATSHNYGLIDNDSIGAYGQASWHISDDLTFTGGLRYSVDDKRLEIRVNNYNRSTGLTSCSVASSVTPTVINTPFDAGGEVVGPARCGLRRSDDFSGVSYTAGFDYKVNDDVLVYLKTSKGFRSGGQNLRAPNTAAFIPFAPEKALAYEIGFKSQFLDNRVRFNAAAYITDVKDIQRSTLIATPPLVAGGVPGTATILGNAGKARFKGFEAELAVAPVEGLRLSASAAVTDAKYVRFADLSGDRSFERFAGVAKTQLSFAADYGVNFGSSTKLKLHADYSWRSKVASGDYNFPANPSNQQIIAATTAPALGLIGARASLEFNENYEIATFARNIGNKRSYTGILLVAPLGYATGVRNEPTTYGITGTVKF
jgi:iron complex outermembrane receptor protein